jgi:UDP-N-acetylglucosamine--dolichyl-phosphate N-acetylglucosaminephosphotransferase
MEIYFVILFVSFIVTYVAISWLIPQLLKAGITGKDMNKPGKPEVAEMGGLGIAVGLASGILLAIAMDSFFNQILMINREGLLAAIQTVLIIVIIGIVDDLFGINHGLKSILPMFAALPLVAVKVGKTVMEIPFYGPVDFGILYSLILVPLGITGAANGVNMLAGFNGLEAGMGIAAIGSLAYIAYTLSETTSLVLLMAMLGALLAALYFNWYPARILIGDVGTLMIGAVIAAAVILGNFESAGAIVIMPYFIDLVIKAANGLPSKGWWGAYKDGKLYCPNCKPVGLCQWIMKLSGGIAERYLVLSLIGIEAFFGLIAIILFARFQ